MRRIKRQLIDLIFRKVSVFDLNQIFTAHLTGWQVQADGNALVGFGQTKQRQELKAHLRRDMIDNRAIFDGFDLQFVILAHTVSPYRAVSRFKTSASKAWRA